jgi:hypothetical protein
MVRRESSWANHGMENGWTPWSWPKATLVVLGELDPPFLLHPLHFLTLVLAFSSVPFILERETREIGRVNGAKGQGLGYFSTSCWHVGHVGSMGDNSFPTVSEVTAFLSDHPIVATGCPIGYCLLILSFGIWSFQAQGWLWLTRRPKLFLIAMTSEVGSLEWHLPLLSIQLTLVD